MSSRYNCKFCSLLLSLFSSAESNCLRRRTQWAYLGELLDKLLFLVVSGDGEVTFLNYTFRKLMYIQDPTFISNFLLTYRRFATPRNVLLAMQKRMRQFDDPCGDPMFACFAQMRFVNLTRSKTLI